MSLNVEFLTRGPRLVEWRLANFKSILDARLVLAPLTIVTGANSSGKSSVLQSMLALAQTFADADEAEAQFVLNGPLVRLGSVSDVVCSASESKTLSVGFTLDCLNIIEDADFGPISTGDCVEGLDVSFEIQLESGQSLSPHDVRPRVQTSTFAGKLRGAATTYDDLYRMAKEWNADVLQEEPEAVDDQADVDASQIASTIGVTDFSFTWVHFKNEAMRSGAKAAVGVMEESSSAELTRAQIFMLGQPQPKEWTPVWREWSRRSIPLSYLFKPSSSLLFMVTRHLLPHQLRVACDGRILLAEKWLLSALSPGHLLPQNFLGGIACPRTLAKLFDSHLETNGISGRAFRKRKGLSLAEAISVLQPVAKAADLYRLFVDNYDLIMRCIVDSLPPTEQELVPDPLPLSAGVAKVAGEVLNFFRQRVHYIGPLRVEPLPTYPNTYLRARYVGRKGEETASILTSRQDQLVEYPVPPRAEGNCIRGASLLDATVDWLRYLGICQEIQIRDLGRPGFEVLIKTSERGPVHDLTHAGVGVSQVLPLVVQGLVALPGDHLIIEQPELHLHPAVQAKLGDFFLALTFKDVRCIIESHSEHLIDRVRYRIASSETDDLRQRLALYFVEKPEEVSVFRRIDVDQYGALLEWPAGFFDQSTLEAEQILKAGIVKRRREMN